MSVLVSTMQNEQAKVDVLVGREVVTGDGGSPTFRVGGKFQSQKTKPLVRKPSGRRSYAGHRTPKRATQDVTGTYTTEDEGGLSFEDFCVLLEYGVGPHVAAVSDGNTVPSYPRDLKPSSRRIPSAVVEAGWPGMVFVNTGVRLDEFTLSGDMNDADDAWKLSSNLFIRDKKLKDRTALTATGGTTTLFTVTGAAWTLNEHAGKYLMLRSGTAGNIRHVREVLSNTATGLVLEEPLPAAVTSGDVGHLSGAFTAGITDRAVDYIQMSKTGLFVADTYADLASADELVDLLVSWSVTQKNGLSKKKRSGNAGAYSRKTGRGFREVSGELRLEFDTWAEYENFEASYPPDRAVRIQGLGPQINASPATFKTAQINLPAIQWDAADPNQWDANNGVLVLPFLAYDRDATFGAEVGYFSRTTLASLPA